MAIPTLTNFLTFTDKRAHKDQKQFKRLLSSTGSLGISDFLEDVDEQLIESVWGFRFR